MDYMKINFEQMKKKNIIFLLSLFTFTLYCDALPPSFEGFWHNDMGQSRSNGIAISGQHIAWDNKIWTIVQSVGSSNGEYSINLKSDKFLTNIKVRLQEKHLIVVSSNQESFKMANTGSNNQNPENPWPTKTTFDLAGTATISGKVCDSTLKSNEKLMIFYHNEYTHKKEWFTCDIAPDGLFNIKIPIHKPSLVTVKYKERSINMVCAPNSAQILFFKSYEDLWQSWEDLKQPPSFSISIDQKKVNDRAFFMGGTKEFNTMYNYFQDVTSSIDRTLRRDEFNFKDKEEAKRYFSEYQVAIMDFIDKLYAPKLDQSFKAFVEDEVKFRLAYDLIWKIRKFDRQSLSDEDFESLTSKYLVNITGGSMQTASCRHFIENLFDEVYGKNKGLLKEVQRDSIYSYMASGLIKLNTNNLELVKESFLYQHNIYQGNAWELPDSLLDEQNAMDELDNLLDDAIKYEMVNNKIKNQKVKDYLRYSILTQNGLEFGIPISSNQLAIFYRKNKGFRSPEFSYINSVNEQQKKITAKFPTFDNKSCGSIKNFKYLQNESEYRSVIEKNTSSTQLIFSLPKSFDEEIFDITIRTAQKLQAQHPTLSVSFFIYRNRRCSMKEFLGIQGNYANYLANNGFLQNAYFISDSVSLWYEWGNRFNQGTTFKVYRPNIEEVKVVLPSHYDPEVDFQKIVEELVTSAFSAELNHISMDLEEVPNSWRLMYSGDGVFNYVFSEWKNIKNIDKDVEMYLSRDKTYQIERLIPTEEYGVFTKQLEDEGKYQIDTKTQIISLISNAQGKSRKYKIISCGPESLILREVK